MIAHATSSDVRKNFEAAFDEPARIVREHPMPSLFVVFGVGLGVGFLIGHAMCAPLAYYTREDPSFTGKTRPQRPGRHSPSDSRIDFAQPSRLTGDIAPREMTTIMVSKLVGHQETDLRQEKDRVHVSEVNASTILKITHH
jgi:hypothetical protein